MSAEIPDLTAMTDSAQWVALEYWGSGYTAGFLAGMDAAEEAQAALDRAVAASASVIARGIPFADLCERRGEPERAARQRRALAERGVA